MYKNVHPVKIKKIRAYEPITPETYDDPGTASYVGTLAKLERGDAAAGAAFAALMGLRADDRLVGFHLKRLLNGQTGSPFDVI